MRTFVRLSTHARGSESKNLSLQRGTRDVFKNLSNLPACPPCFIQVDGQHLDPRPSASLKGGVDGWMRRWTYHSNLRRRAYVNDRLRAKPCPARANRRVRGALLRDERRER